VVAAQASPRFEVLHRLGVGGMAEVFLARGADGELVAVKRLLAGDTDRLDLFLDEARIAAQFVHPNIVRCHELGCDDQGLYLVLEYVDGRSLAAIVERARRGPPLSRELAAYVVAEVARALDHVHRAAVIHRDVNPSNVLVSMAGDVKLTDFGIAKARDAIHRTRTGVVRGTRGYLSPEQQSGGTVGATSDVWSAGVLLWETTLGRFPDGPAPPPSSVDPGYPEELARVVVAALAPDPGERSSAAELRAGIERYLATIDPPPSGTALANEMIRWFADQRTPPRELAAPTRLLAAARPAAPRTRRRWAWLAAATGLVAAIGVTAALWSRGDRTAPPAHPGDDLAAAWRVAQHGGHEQARELVDVWIDALPADPDVAALAVLVHWWIGTTRIEQLLEHAERTRLPPERRALLHGIRLLHLGRDAEAVIAMEAAEARVPGTAEIAYALGEARWHAGDRAGGVEMLTAALRRDPRWQMALHHVVDYHVARGDAAAVRAAGAIVAGSDAAAARALEVTALIAARRYAEALAAAQAATERCPDDAPLWQLRTAAEVLTGELDDAARSVERAVELWPLDERTVGPFNQLVELRLYANDELGFEASVGARFSPANLLRLAVWHDGSGLPDDAPNRDGEGPRRGNGQSAMAAPPLHQSVAMLGAHHHGVDASEFWTHSPYAEVRGFGAGLAAVRAGDPVAAEAHFAAALDASLPETRPLFAYYLARARRDRGDATGAAAACDEVIRPRGYVTYRAVLLRDCARWIGAAR
jgi:tetratricopeptide (TPR) repeat protein